MPVLCSVLSPLLTVAMVSLLPGQLPGVLHPQPAQQRDPEHAEETLSSFWQSRGLQSHHLQRVSALTKVTQHQRRGGNLLCWLT